jgi:hypothetical protein
MEQDCTYFANFGADDAKVAKDATPNPNVGLDENGTQFR